MSIKLNDSIRVQGAKPVEDKSLNNGAPYISVAQVTSLIAKTDRYPGLSVVINDGDNKEYWFKDGIEDVDLILKGAEPSTDSDTVARTINFTLEDLGVATESEITPQMVADYFNSLSLEKSENEFYILKQIIYNFDVTANWNLTTDGDGNSSPITDATSFKTWLESGWTPAQYDSPNSFQDVVVSDFSLVNGRLQGIVSTSGGDYFALETLEVTDVKEISIGDYNTLGLGINQITEFNPTIALPTGLQYLDLTSNQITDFNPTFALPTGLQDLYLNSNQITTFNPTQPLPSGLRYLYLYNNQITTFNPTQPLPTGLQNLYLSSNQITTFNPTIPLPTGLQNLLLENNQITTFNPTQPLPTGLKNLYLNNNQITDWSLSEPWANSLPNGTTNILTYKNLTSSNGTTFKSILTGKGYAVQS